MIIDKNNKKYSKSSTFLLPMLDIPLDSYKNFNNVYYKSIYDKDKEVKRIYVVYNKNYLTEDILKSLNKSIYYQDMYEVDGFSVLRYRVPDKYITDFILFCEGKYNHFSTEYKQVLLNSYIIKRTELNKILNSLETDRKKLADKYNVDIRDIKEIYPIPDEIEETFTIANNYKLEI